MPAATSWSRSTRSRRRASSRSRRCATSWSKPGRRSAGASSPGNGPRRCARAGRRRGNGRAARRYRLREQADRAGAANAAGTDQGINRAVVQALFATAPGKVADEVIQLDDGFAVVATDEVIAADPAANSEGMEQLARELEGDMRSDLVVQFEAQLRREYPIEIDGAAINRLIEMGATDRRRRAVVADDGATRSRRVHHGIRGQPAAGGLDLAGRRSGDAGLRHAQAGRGPAVQLSSGIGRGRRGARPLLGDRAEARPDLALLRRARGGQPARAPGPGDVRAVSGPGARRAAQPDRRDAHLPAGGPAADGGRAVRLHGLRHGAPDGAPAGRQSGSARPAGRRVHAAHGHGDLRQHRGSRGDRDAGVAGAGSGRALRTTSPASAWPTWSPTSIAVCRTAATATACAACRSQSRM